MNRGCSAQTSEVYGIVSSSFPGMWEGLQDETLVGSESRLSSVASVPGGYRAPLQQRTPGYRRGRKMFSVVATSLACLQYSSLTSAILAELLTVPPFIQKCPVWTIY